MAANKSKLIASAQRYSAKGQHRKAVAEYQRALKLEPGDVRTQLKLGEALQRAGATREACDAFVDVAKKYVEQGFLLKAVAVYKQILKIDRALPDVHLLLAQTYQHLGLADAVNQYHEAVILLEQQGRTLEKLHVIRKLLDLEPDNLLDRIKLAEAYSGAGRTDDAATLFRQVFGALKQRGHVDDAIKVGERLLYHRRDDFDVSKELAQCYLKRDVPQWALPKLQACFRQRPRDTEVLEMLVEAFEALGQVHKAIAVLKDMAHIYEESGLTREYQDMMARVLDLNPDDRDAQAALRASRTPELKPEIVFDEGAAEDTAEEIAVDDVEVDEEPGFGGEDDGGAARHAAPPPRPAPSATARASERSAELRPGRGVVKPPQANDDQELPFDVDEQGNPAVGHRSATSSGADPAEVISSATLEVVPREHELPFEDDGEPQDLDFVESEATIVDAAALEAVLGQRTPADLREELRELDFYLEQGFEPEARTLYGELKSRFPGHPELVARAELVPVASD